MLDFIKKVTFEMDQDPGNRSPFKLKELLRKSNIPVALGVWRG